MFKPAMPFVTDAVAHLLFFKDHMDTVHAHNGKYHVHTEISEGAKNDQEEKSTNNFKKETSNEHIIVEATLRPSILLTPINCFSLLSMSAVNTYINHDFPPPRA